jgi:hypothetical protein
MGPTIDGAGAETPACVQAQPAPSGLPTPGALKPRIYLLHRSII